MKTLSLTILSLYVAFGCCSTPIQDSPNACDRLSSWETALAKAGCRVPMDLSDAVTGADPIVCETNTARLDTCSADAQCHEDMLYARMEACGCTDERNCNAPSWDDAR